MALRLGGVVSPSEIVPIERTEDDAPQTDGGQRATRQSQEEAISSDSRLENAETTPNTQGSLAVASNPAYQTGGVVSAPVLLKSVEPELSEQARQTKVGGNVLVSLVVDTNGIPQNVQVIRGIGSGLDEKAIEAVKQYRFKPALKDGRPVVVNLKVDVNFQAF